MKKTPHSTSTKTKTSAKAPIALGEIADLDTGLPDNKAKHHSSTSDDLNLDMLEDLYLQRSVQQTRANPATAEEAFLSLEDLMQNGELNSDWQLELMAKNPALCNQLHEISSKNDLDIDEVGEYLVLYYSDYKKTLRPQTDRSLAEIVSVYNCLGMAAPLTLGELLSRRPEEVDSLYRQTSKLVDELPKPEEFQQQNLAQLLVVFARTYSEQVFDDEFMDTVTAYTKRALKDDTLTDDLMASLRVVAASRNPKCLHSFMSYHHELVKSSQSQQASIVDHYFQLHGLDDLRVQGFRDNVFPMMEAHDAEVAILDQPHGAWAVNYGEFGLADFVCHCLVSIVNPRTLAELLWAYRTILTGNLQRFREVRYDAAQLQDILFPDYGFIYDGRPEAHDFLQTMVDFYEASENGATLEATVILQRALAACLSSAGAKYYDGFDQFIFNLDNYDRPVHLTDKNGAEYRAPAIEVLRRLTKNTDQSAIIKPKTGDIELDTLIDEIEIWVDPDDGQTKTDWQQTGELIKCLNGILLEKQGNVGLRPSFIATINFAESLAAHTLASLTAQDRIEMPFDDTFKEILKFRELILSPDKFNAAGFEKFWQKFANANVEDVFSMRASFKLLKQRIYMQLEQLSSLYLENPHTAHLVKGLWQDALVQEICHLTNNQC